MLAKRFGYLFVICAASASFAGPRIIKEFGRYMRCNLAMSPKRGDNDTIHLWPNATIPYNFSHELISHPDWSNWVDDIEFAMKLLSTATCVKFIPVEPFCNDTNPCNDYVTITLGSSDCNSPIGYFPGLGEHQIVFSHGCYNHQSIYHQLLHILGYAHEHQRLDRNKYIEVFKSNIMEGELVNYAPYADAHVLANFSIPYDPFSATHFDAVYAARRRTLVTMVTRHPKLFPLSHDHKANDGEPPLSKLDLRKIRAAYNCSASECEDGHWQMAISWRHGFRGEKVKILSCRSLHRIVLDDADSNETSPGSCEDVNENCWFAGREDCQSDVYVRQMCPRKCGNCGGLKYRDDFD